MNPRFELIANAIRTLQSERDVTELDEEFLIVFIKAQLEKIERGE